MDFKEIINSTDRYNFHSHTEFCDGHATMATMARAAVAAGMEHYGFTPHSPIPIASPCNMAAEKVDDFRTEFNRVRRLPELASCRFYIGMEVDYLGPQWGPASDYFKTLGLDYTIGSVHFIPTQEGEYVDVDGSHESFTRRLKERFRGDLEYIVDTFYAQSRAMLAAGGFDILGHFDKIGHNASHIVPGIEDSSFYRDLTDDYVDRIIASGVVVELNTKAYRRAGRFFPQPALLEHLVEGGVTILVNSDAHDPALIDAGRAEGYELLKKYGYGR
ncbi:MAG: histidinol-phosphatase HisJ family protein [Muribaculaceae bacterium]|nr:histidinol-phosphatase HisJ family protein [Muribaculaceae bacterium]